VILREKQVELERMNPTQKLPDQSAPSWDLAQELKFDNLDFSVVGRDLRLILSVKPELIMAVKIFDVQV
jgi:hypothetical protein